MAEISNLKEREEMVAICRRMNASGINQGTAGNLSLRTGPEEKFLDAYRRLGPAPFKEILYNQSVATSLTNATL